MDIDAEIKRLQELQKELLKQAECERAARKAACPRIMKFTIARAKVDSFTRLYDDSCYWLRLTGEVTNKVECKAAGWADSELYSGGLNYLFNDLSKKIVMSHGGGTYYIQDETFWGDGESLEVVRARAIAILNRVVARFAGAEGEVDISDIVKSQPNYNKWDYA